MRAKFFLSPSARRLLVAVAVVAIIAARKHDTFSNPQLWAEDGGLFLSDAEKFGWGALFKSYEGYLHLLPRFIAVAGNYLPIITIPVFYATAALLITGVIAWTVQSPRVRIRATWAGALAIASAPHHGEVYLTICNLQWITALGLFALAAMDDAVTREQRAADVALLIATGLTGPFIVLALPLFAWRAWRRRSTWSYGLLGIAAACALAHVPGLLARAPSKISEPWHPIQYLSVIGERVWIKLFAGWHVIDGTWSATLSLAVFLALGALLWRGRKNLQASWVLLFAALAILAAVAYKSRIDTWSLREAVNGDRYFFTPQVLLLWLIAALVSLRGIQGRIVRGLVLLVPVAVNFNDLVYPPYPDQQWAHYAELIEDGKPTMVPILPAGFKLWHPGRHDR